LGGIGEVVVALRLVALASTGAHLNAWSAGTSSDGTVSRIGGQSGEARSIVVLLHDRDSALSLSLNEVLLEGHPSDIGLRAIWDH